MSKFVNNFVLILYSYIVTGMLEIYFPRRLCLSASVVNMVYCPLTDYRFDLLVLKVWH